MNAVRRVGAASCVAFLVGVIGAGGAGAATVSAEDYVQVLCTSLGDLSTTITDGQRTVKSELEGASSIADVKAAFVSFLDGSISAGEEAAAGLKASGNPDVENGAGIATTIRKAFKVITKTFTEVRGDAAALSATDAQKFQRGVKRIQDKLDRATARFGETIDAAQQKYGDVEELDDAFNAEPACSSAS